METAGFWDAIALIMTSLLCELLGIAERKDR